MIHVLVGLAILLPPAALLAWVCDLVGRRVDGPALDFHERVAGAMSAFCVLFFVALAAWLLGGVAAVVGAAVLR